jgi:adhesin/invasin
LIGVNDETELVNTAVGVHTVVLSNVAGNCTVAGGASKDVSVTAGATADVSFAITCTSIPPSASRSDVSVDPDNIPAGTGSSTITVTVRDASGNPLGGVTVTPTSTGTGNVFTPTSGATDGNGLATFSFSSTVAEKKTIGASADGVTLKDTAVITVFRRSSTIQITGDAPDPSDPGVDITVTFTVTGVGGGTPTGTVTIYSSDEADVGCTVNLSQGSSCQFPLHKPGLQHLQATYSGDSQF